MDIARLDSFCVKNTTRTSHRAATQCLPTAVKGPFPCNSGSRLQPQRPAVYQAPVTERYLEKVDASGDWKSCAAAMALAPVWGFDRGSRLSVTSACTASRWPVAAYCLVGMDDFYALLEGVGNGGRITL